MKKAYILITLAAIVFQTNAQTLYVPNGTIGNNTTNGNVGIGTQTPAIWFPGKVLEVYDSRPVLKLRSGSTNLSTVTFTNDGVNTNSHLGEFHVNHQYNIGNPSLSQLRFSSYPVSEILTLRSDGNVGMGTVSPGTWFGGRALEISDNWPVLKLTSNATNIGTVLFTNASVNATTHQGEFNINHYFNTENNSESSLRISSYPAVNILTLKSDGNVGIGTASPDAKLAVDGTIHTREVRVDMNNWNDYVFEEDYDLPSLSEIEKYVRQHKHLPEVPSASEVIRNGVHLGEMSSILLKKIEEMTLYMIDLEKKLNDQREIAAQQAMMIEQLKSEMSTKK